MNYDIIIAGGGLSGLTASAFLSKRGFKTLLIDKNTTIGGFASSFIERGFHFDYSLHNFGEYGEDLNICKIFNELEIADRLEFIEFKESQTLIFPDMTFCPEPGIDNYIKDLIKLFPEEERGIKKLFKVFLNINSEYKSFDRTDILLEQIEEKMPMFGFAYPNIAFLSDKLLSEFLDDYVKNSKLKSIINSLWWLFGLPPESLMAILYPVLFWGYFNSAGGIFKNTSTAIVDALEKVITENKGDILTGGEVINISMIGEEKFIVKLKNGDTFQSEAVLSTISTYNLYKTILDKEIASEKELLSVDNYQHSISATQLFVGTKKPLADLGVNRRSLMVFTEYDHNENFDFIAKGDYGHTLFSMTNYSLFDDSLCGQDRGLFNILFPDSADLWFNLDRDQIDERKEMIKRVMLERVYKLFPSIKNEIEVTKITTPLDIRNVSGNIYGSIYGLAQVRSQAGKERHGYKTNINNLFIAGSDVFPGAGYQSVISSAYKISKEIAGTLKR